MFNILKSCCQTRSSFRPTAIASFAAFWMVMAPPAAFSAQSCESLVGFSLESGQISSAQTVAAGSFLPPDTATPVSIPFPFCRVAGVLTPTSDSHIRFEVWLPLVNWNGKLDHGGNGGYGGSFSTPAGFMVQGLLRGYVTTGTDMGHDASVTPGGSFALGHPEKTIDWASRANHVTSKAAKLITKALYGKLPRLSYFTGCSDGGHEGLMEAQRFPEDYDGIVAGAPANFWTHQSAAWVWEARATLDNPASFIPTSKLPVIFQAAVAACQGPVPGFVDNPLQCNFDPGTLLCTASDGPNCLTQPQVDAARKIYAGPFNPHTGARIYPGLEPGSEASQGLGAASSWAALISGPQTFLGGDFYKYMVFEDLNWNFHTLDFDRDIAFADAKMHSVVDSTSPDLSAFRDRGGKMIMYHGWADPLVNPRNSINYYRSVMGTLRPDNSQEADARKHGGDDEGSALERTQKFLRLFMAPGLAHCSGGPGLNTFDTLSALEAWVERRVAPETLAASHTTLPFPANVSTSAAGDFSRPLCAYPRVARWTRVGSANDARRYVCGGMKDGAED
jgi:feruloyl esterase